MVAAIQKLYLKYSLNTERSVFSNLMGKLSLPTSTDTAGIKKKIAVNKKSPVVKKYKLIKSTAILEMLDDRFTIEALRNCPLACKAAVKKFVNKIRVDPRKSTLKSGVVAGWLIRFAKTGEIKNPRIPTRIPKTK